MCRQSPLVGILLAVPVIWASGCRPQQPHYLFEDGDLSHYLEQATDIEYADARVPSLDEVAVDGANRPLTLEHGIDPDKIVPISLEEAIRIALANSKIIRYFARSREFEGVDGRLWKYMPEHLTNPLSAVRSTYDPALAEADPLYGPEAALSAFDAQLKASLNWELNDRPQNVIQDPTVSQIILPTFQQDLGAFSAEISKTTASGGRFAIRHNVDYDWNNTPSRRWPSDWYTDVEAEFRQPLLQGAGVQFNRIAGPGATPGVYNGVVIARIRTDIALAEFEYDVCSLVRDVERAYWHLYARYHLFDSAKKARDSALGVWKRLYDLSGHKEDTSGSQAREQYLAYLESAQVALNGLYAAENSLRYIMGISATDGRLLRPSDEPTTAKIEFPWPDIHYEAMARNVLLRRERWKVKQREMELIAAKNHLLPKLDAVGRYRWLGLGDDLIHSEGDPANRFDTAYQNMLMGDYQEWQFGVELSIPIGFRREMAGVRHAQLSLARERSLLQEQELEVSHQLAQAIRELEGYYRVAQTAFTRLEAARHNVILQANRLEELPQDVLFNPEKIKVLLDAQKGEWEAEQSFYESLSWYAVANAEVHYRKGSLLEYNNVCLAEGPWPAKAYFDATRRARARDAAIYMDYGYTRPKVISRGSYEQHVGTTLDLAPGMERIVTPEPEPQLAPEPIPPGQAEPLNGSQGGSNRSASVSKAAGFRLATDGSAGAPSVAASRSAGTTAAAQKGSAGSGRGWAALAAKSAATSAPGAGGQVGVRPASYQQQVASPASRGGWTAKQSSGQAASAQHESVQNLPPGQADRPSSGWKAVQR